MSSRRPDGDAGFSLIELLVVCTLTVIVGGVAANGMITGLRTTQRQNSRVHALNDVKKTFERVTRDVRGANPLLVANVDSLQVREVQSGLRRTTRYYLDGDDLVSYVEEADASTGALVGSTESVVLRDIEVPADGQVFRYYDSTGTELGQVAANAYDPDSAAVVEVRFSVNLDRSDDTVDLSERITLRNTEA